jgi:hypothetical protein
MNSHGGKRPGAGRPKGSPNKLSGQQRKAIRTFVDADFNPLEAMIAEARDPETPKALKARLLIELAKFNFPRCAIERAAKPAPDRQAPGEKTEEKQVT